MSNLCCLADRCEAASGPDRELDLLIAVAVRWCPAGIDPVLLANPSTRPLYLGRAPAYTASLDAAMSLVPEGCRAEVVKAFDGRGEYAVITWAEKAIVDDRTIFMNPSTRATAATPALALTAACLRARHAQQIGEAQ